MTDQFEQPHDESTVHVDLVSYMQPLTDVKDQKVYYLLGRVRGVAEKHLVAVTPKGGDGKTMLYCLHHHVAFGLKGFCVECRLQVHE